MYSLSYHLISSVFPLQSPSYTQTLHVSYYFMDHSIGPMIYNLNLRRQMLFAIREYDGFHFFQIITKRCSNIFQIWFVHLFDNKTFLLISSMHNCTQKTWFDILQTKYDWNSTAH